MRRQIGPTLTKFERRRIARLAADGLTQTEIARLVSRSQASVSRVLRGVDSREGKHGGGSVAAVTERLEREIAPKVYVGELGTQARECLADLNAFCETYFPAEPLNSYQRMLARDVYSPDSPRFTLVLGPPRHGKSTLLAVRAAIWYLAGGGHQAAYYENPDNPLRDAEVMLVAAAQEQVRKKARAVIPRLEYPTDALHAAYGEFRGQGLAWQRTAGNIVVAGRRLADVSGDWSLTTVGMGGEVLGQGANLIVVDDAASLHNCGNEKDAERLFAWLRDHVFSRLNNAGDHNRIVVNGHHLPVTRDLYSHIEEMDALDLVAA